MRGIGHDHQLGRTARRLDLVDVRLRVRGRSDAIVAAGDHDDRSGGRQQLRGGGVCVHVGPFGARLAYQ
jgi:hypothetical protein